MLVINSYTINLTAILTTLRSFFTDHFQQDKLQHLTCSQDFKVQHSYS